MLYVSIELAKLRIFTHQLKKKDFTVGVNAIYPNFKFQ